MPYKNNIPLGTDLISLSQQDLNDNFHEIKTVIDIDHETFAAANQGKHKQVTFPVQAADPATAVDEVALYCKDNAAGDPALFFKPENQGVGATERDFTTATLAVTGTCKLPCGIVLKWGTGAIAGGSQTSGAITFITAFSGAIYNVTVNPSGMMPGAAQDSVLHVVNAGVANFQVTRNNHYVGTTVNFYYLAIGV